MIEAIFLLSVVFGLVLFGAMAVRHEIRGGDR